MSVSISNEIIDLIPVLTKTVRIIEEPQGAIFVNYAIKEKYGRFLLSSPFEAFIMCLFDGTRSVGDIANLLKILRDSPAESAIQSDVCTFIRQKNEFVELINSPLEKSRIKNDPLKFLLKNNIFLRPIRSSKPLWVDLYVTRECNLKCIYCFANAKYIYDNNSIDQPKRMNDLIDQIAGLEIKKILITGGEPTLISDLPNIIDQLTKHDIEVILATNAYSMNENMAERLRESGVQEVQAKLDASNPIIQDKLSGVAGSFVKLIDGIRTLRKHFSKLSVASVTTSLNIMEIPKVIRICADLGVDEVSPRIYTPGIWALSGRGGAYLNPPPNSILWLEEKIAELKEQYKGIIKIEPIESKSFSKRRENEVAMCPGFVSSCTILENGLVVPCETLSDFSNDFIIGNANKETILDIWNSEKAEKWVLRESPKVEEPCSVCDEFTRCKGGCPWRSYVAYGNWSVDPYCIKAPKPTKIPFTEISKATKKVPRHIP
jgi:radical SAM protein with 4Fe4S-binding SPASM domain